MKFKFTTLIVAAAFLLSSSFAWSQSQTPLDIALRHIEQNYKIWELTQDDISDITISDMYQSQHNGVTHIYFKQRHQGIALQNAILNLNITEDGKVLFVGKRFQQNLSAAITSTSASINSDQALQKVLNDLNISTELPRPIHGDNEHLFTYEKTDISNFDVNVELTYKNINDEVLLVWNLIIAPVGTTAMWDYNIDANSGQIVEKKDMIIRCKFEKGQYHNHNDCASTALTKKTDLSVEEALVQANTVAGSYRVFPYPAESPIHGDHELVSDPEDPEASPYGWHDINGDPAPDYTITRGNNVYAFEDRDGDGSSNGNDVDGGAGLVFDFPYIADGEAIDNRDAAVTNLFYMNNILHDFSYVYGFNEAAGNFQRNTYGNGGQGNDEVFAYAQANADNGTINNATFGTPPDGSNPSMNMFVWDNPGNKVFNVTAPGSIAGQYTSAAAGFGPAITDIPISAEVVEVDDGVYNPYLTDGCEDYINPGDFDGKIALIDRGGCEFGAKVLRAEEAGAIAVIVCNFDIDPITMGAGAVGAQVTIPSVMIGVNDCQTIRQFVGNGLEVTLVTPAANPGPDFLDGDFDNGIIAHEFAHGISNRLTGGPSLAGCLGGGEQMGEGWSDFFTLITSVKPGDDGETGRGIGTYVQRQETDGPGIRRFRYSTDMNVNPLTYGNVATNQGVHPIGEVWVSMLWDLYWAMVDKHGFDDDQWNGTGGNNMAIQLVMDGMKLQPCNPGFVDGRDAILAADQALFNGENNCLIWDVFARRGCGINADQGDPLNAGDQVESFEPLATCIAELKINKTVSQLVEAGDDIEVTVTIINHKVDTLTNVVVTDEIPVGTEYINGSNSGNVIEGGVNGNIVSFELGTMEYLDEITFTYSLSTDPNNFSVRYFYDDMENIDPTFWFPFADMGTNFWQETTIDAYSGTTSWWVENIELETQQKLQMGQPSQKILIEGDDPTLRFYHRYDTEAGADGGVVQVSTDDGVTWQEIGDMIFRNPYQPIQYGTFVIPDYSAFSGNSEGWIASYADMSDYAGQEVIFRFHFRSDDNTAPATPAGWWVDDVEIMDIITYNGEACVTSDQGDQACDTPESRGTVIESQSTTSTNDPAKSVFMNIFPNPTDDFINLSISSLQSEDVTISILTLDGKVVGERVVTTSTATQTFSMNVSDLPSGFYFVRASTNQDVTVEKVVIQ